MSKKKNAKLPETLPEKTGTKIGRVIGLLRRAEGADIASLSALTGWQAHSVRGAIAGQIKKKLGLTVLSQKADGRTVYRIES